MLEIYNTKLDARAERKAFILERKMLDKKPEKKRTKEEREVYQNMRVFARFHSEVNSANRSGLIAIAGGTRGFRPGPDQYVLSCAG